MCGSVVSIAKNNHHMFQIKVRNNFKSPEYYIALNDKLLICLRLWSKLDESRFVQIAALLTTTHSAWIAGCLNVKIMSLIVDSENLLKPLCTFLITSALTIVCLFQASWHHAGIMCIMSDCLLSEIHMLNNHKFQGCRTLGIHICTQKLAEWCVWHCSSKFNPVL